MKKNMIQSFAVYGLFGTQDVVIPFNEDIKILIGENGIGKTQVLNLFYYTLTKNFFKLSDFQFDSLRLTFSDGKKIELQKRDIVKLVSQTYNNPVIKELIEEIGFSQFEGLRNTFAGGGANRNAMMREYEQSVILKNGRRYPSYIIHRAFEELNELEKNPQSKVLQKCKKDIEAFFGDIDIMYFPTYRRVEEDLHNLGYNEDELNLNQENTLIQFGMDDVKNRFNRIESTIGQLLKEGLAQFTKDILNIVIDDDDSLGQNNVLDKITEADIDIILSRVGTQLPEPQKNAVRSVVANKKQLKNPLSAYLLQKLIDIYEKQKELDNSVKLFRDVCNRYLINKKVFYDESAIKIYIKSESKDDELKLSKLSSGEKQIISIFSKIYLSDLNKRFIVLLDEPELSLSMLWQKQLLPDIINSKKCDFLLAVTHSPFIFDNDLDKYAVGLSEYINYDIPPF